jgi:hypothetical protein
MRSAQSRQLTDAASAVDLLGKHQAGDRRRGRRRHALPSYKQARRKSKSGSPVAWRYPTRSR